MVKQFHSLLKLPEYFAPRHVCWLCEQARHLSLGLCKQCMSDLPYLPPQNCKPAALQGHPCRAWFAPLSYEAPVDRWFAPFKYGHQPQLAAHFAPLIAAHVVSSYRANKIFLPQALVPIPLSNMRWWQRGYNQAGLLAEAIGESLGIPVIYPLRRRYTRGSTRMSAQERIQNLRNAFYMTFPLDMERVALVDDVITSGATLQAAAITLKHARNCVLDAWALAYTP